MLSPFWSKKPLLSLLSFLCFFVSCQSRSSEEAKKFPTQMDVVLDLKIPFVGSLQSYYPKLFYDGSEGPKVWNLEKSSYETISYDETLKNTSFSLGPKSQKLYAIGSNESGAWFLKVSDSKQKNIEEVKFKDKRSRFGPVLSPDEKWVFYSAEQIGSGDVYVEVLNREVSRTFALVAGSGNAGSVSMSPSGKKILWRQVGSRRDVADIFTAELVASGFKLELKNPKNLTQSFRGLHLTPTWISENEILFSSNFLSHQSMDLFYLKLGTDCVRLLSTEAENSHWMPTFDSQQNKVYWVSKSLQSDAQKILSTNWSTPSGSCQNLSKSVNKVLKGMHK